MPLNLTFSADNTRTVANVVSHAFGRVKSAALPAGLPHAADILSLPPPPDHTVNYVGAVGSWILGHNDTIGDCPFVTAANLLLGWTTDAGAPVRWQDNSIVDEYCSLGGYVRDDPSTDRGYQIFNLLLVWSKVGLLVNGHRDQLAGFAQVNPLDRDAVKRCLTYVGPLFCGGGVPLGWTTNSTWSLENVGTAGIPAEDHAFPAVDYNPDGVFVVSWGGLRFVPWSAWEASVDEAHIPISRDALERSGRTPRGLDFAALSARIAVLQRAA